MQPYELSLVLRQHLHARLGSDADGLDAVASHFKPQFCERNQFLLRQGQVCRAVFFLAHGSLQVFSHDSEFNETTRDLVLEGTWCSDLTSFATQQPAGENIRSIEPSSLLALSFQSFQKLMSTVPAFEHIYRLNLEASLAHSVQRVNALVSMTAAQKVARLHAQRPDFVQRIPSKILASYLGISAETYSRMKAKQHLA